MTGYVVLVSLLAISAPLVSAWPLLMGSGDVYIKRLAEKQWVFVTSDDFGYHGLPDCFAKGVDANSCELKLSPSDKTNYTRTMVMFDKPFYVIVNQYKKGSPADLQFIKNRASLAECIMNVYQISNTEDYCIKKKFTDYGN